MSVLFKKEFKLDQTDGQGAGGSGGSGGDGDLLGGADGGGAPKEGNQGSGGAPGEGKPSAGDNSSSSDPKGGAPADWRSALPAELQENSQLQRYKTIADLASGYVNLQRHFSSDKLSIPGKNATDDDWKGVFEKLGVPKEVKDYTVKFQEGVTVEPKFVDEFRATAHAAGILPKQAQKLADWFSEKNKTAETAMQTEIKAHREKELGALKTAWGDAYDKKIALANALFSEAPPEVQKEAKEAGLAASPKFVKLLATLAEKYMTEDAVRDTSTNSGGAPRSPEEAQKEIASIQGNPDHPYYLKEHPGHRAAVAEMSKLFAMAHPARKV